MSSINLPPQDQAALVIEYTDPIEGFKGWLAINSLDYQLCAGGMRVQKGITREHVCRMANNMSKKMKICGLPIDGAKCGIDYDHTGPGKKAAMARFIKAIKPFVRSCYSMGPDLNTDMEELESIARDIGLTSIKMAIANAQGMTLESFQNRYKILSQEACNGWTLGSIRAGHGVAAATLATLEFLNIPCSTATVAMQGFGTLAKAALLGLTEKGVHIVAVADAEKSIQAATGDTLLIDPLLKAVGTLLPAPPDGPPPTGPTSAIFDTPCDILILAAIENAITAKNAKRLQCRAVVPGANLAVTSEAEEILFNKGIPVLPCFLAGCGGSLSMNGLFGPENDPSPQDVLGFIDQQMRKIVIEILQESGQTSTTPTQTAEKICRESEIVERDRPYSI